MCRAMLFVFAGGAGQSTGMHGRGFHLQARAASQSKAMQAAKYEERVGYTPAQGKPRETEETQSDTEQDVDGSTGWLALSPRIHRPRQRCDRHTVYIRMRKDTGSGANRTPHALCPGVQPDETS